MVEHTEDELAPSQVEGFKVGEKKTMDEYTELDKDDPALARWKASLGIGSGTPVADASDPRRCIVQTLVLELEDRPHLTIDLTNEAEVKTLASRPFTLKEGAKYKLRATFKVQHEFVSGLKYVQLIKRKKVRMSKDEYMIGSFAPNTDQEPTHAKTFAEEEFPAGMLARGHYEAVSTFVDDDKTTHAKIEWSFDIAKDWKD